MYLGGGWRRRKEDDKEEEEEDKKNEKNRGEKGEKEKQVKGKKGGRKIVKGERQEGGRIQNAPSVVKQRSRTLCACQWNVVTTTFECGLPKSYLQSK